MKEKYPDFQSMWKNAGWTIEEAVEYLAFLQLATKEDVEKSMQILHMIIQAIGKGSVTTEFVMDLLQKKMEMDATYDEGNLFSSLQ